MKKFLLVVAVVAVSGCAVYPAPAYQHHAGPVLMPYEVEQPVYVYGSAYSYGGHRGYPRGYHRSHSHAQPAAAPQPAPRSRLHTPPHPHEVRESIHDRLREGPSLPRLPHFPHRR